MVKYNVFIDNELMGDYTFKEIKKEIREFIKWENKDTPQANSKKEYKQGIKELIKNNVATICGSTTEIIKLNN